MPTGPGGWLLLTDRIRQSYVDLDDPTYLDFEYVQAFADVIELLPDGPLAVTHVGGAGCTLARYIAARRPGSPQIVLEPDTALTATVRARLPFARGAADPGPRRSTDGPGSARWRAASADVVVLDAYLGGRVPAELTTTEFLADVARVLRPDGVLLANLADGPPLRYSRRVARTVAAHLPHVALRSDAAVFRGRRFGNVVLAASRGRAARRRRSPAPRRRRCSRSGVLAGARARDIRRPRPRAHRRRPDALARTARRDLARAVTHTAMLLY